MRVRWDESVRGGGRDDGDPGAPRSERGAWKVDDEGIDTDNANDEGEPYDEDEDDYYDDDEELDESEDFDDYYDDEGEFFC